VNLIAVDRLSEPLEVRAKIRHSHVPVPASLAPHGDGQGNSGEAVVRFAQPQRAVTPGQSVVFYRGDLVVGGGVIERSLQA
jgi:tRNA-specific 2-thiouridylase